MTFVPALPRSFGSGFERRTVWPSMPVIRASLARVFAEIGEPAVTDLQAAHVGEFNSSVALLRLALQSSLREVGRARDARVGIEKDQGPDADAPCRRASTALSRSAWLSFDSSR